METKDKKPKEEVKLPREVQLLKKLTDTLGFDPTKSPKADKETFGKVLQKISKERQEEAEKKAEALTREAILAADAFSKEAQKYEALKKKFIESFTKVMNKIESLANGTEYSEPENKETDSKEV